MVEEMLCCHEQRFNALEQFAVSDFAPAVPPKHRNRVEAQTEVGK